MATEIFALRKTICEYILDKHANGKSIPVNKLTHEKRHLP